MKINDTDILNGNCIIPPSNQVFNQGLKKKP